MPSLNLDRVAMSDNSNVASLRMLDMLAILLFFGEILAACTMQLDTGDSDNF